jgi:hypothetical protein
MNTEHHVQPRTRADWLWFGALCLSMLAAYASTLCPTVYWYDSAEFATAAAVRGIPHPPGYPLYTLLGSLYVMLVPGEPALGVNVMSAVHGALCVGLLFLLQRQLRADRLSALCGALLFGTGPSFWLNASVAEVYTTGLLFALTTWVLLLEALTTHRRRLLIAAAFVGGLGFAAHMFVATLGLGYVFLVWDGARVQGPSERSSAARRLRTIGLCATATLAGASLYAYVPLRARMHPLLSYMDPETPSGFLWMVTGGNYKTWFLHGYNGFERLLMVLAMLDNHLSDMGLVLGTLGLVVLIARQQRAGWALLLGAAGNLWFFFNYDVHDVEVFFLPTAALLCACIGPLLTQVRAILANKASTRLIANLALGTCLAYAGLRGVLVAPAVDLSHERAAQRYGQELVTTLPRDAIILVFGTPDEWKYRTVFDYYFQKVLGQRPDVQAVDLPGDFVQRVRSGPSQGPRHMPPILQQVFRSQRPVYMYTAVAGLDSLFNLTPEGSVVRVSLKPIL